jgi:hypothetical protein
VCTTVASHLLVGPLEWIVAQSGQRVRIDGYTMLAGPLAATAIMLRGVDARSWRDVGLGLDAARPRPLLHGWCIGGAAIGAACLLLLLFGWARLLPSEDGSVLGAALRVSAFLIPAALAEEIMCRGYLLTVVADRVGMRAAVVLTSLMFGVLHLWNPGATPGSVAIVALAGIFLAAVRVALNSLYAAWMAHLAWNWVMAVPLHAPVSGLRFEHPDYQLVSEGPGWITGGSWGPEGGLAAALGMIAGLAYLYTRRRREES